MTDTQDTHTIKKKSKFHTFLKLMLAVVIVFIVLICSLVYAASTEKGTNYFLSLINENTGVEITDTHGDIVNGLHIDQLILPLAENSLVIDKAVIKIGWQSLVNANKLHVRKLHAEKVVFHKNSISNNKTFSFPSVSTTYPILLEDLAVNSFVLKSKQKKDQVFTGISSDTISFVEDELQLKNTYLQYSNYIYADGVDATVSFIDKYPVHATGKLTVPLFTKAKFSTFDTVASGTIKDLKAQLKSKWDNTPIEFNGGLEVVGKRLPYYVSTKIPNLRLPYLASQELDFSDAHVTAKGTLDKISFDITTQLKGKYVPQGTYTASGYLPFKDFENTNKQYRHLRHVSIKSIEAQTDGVDMRGKGVVAWQKGVDIKLDAAVTKVDTQQISAIKVPASVHRFIPLENTGVLKLNYASQPKTNTNSAKLDLSFYQNKDNNIVFDMLIPKSKQKNKQSNSVFTAKTIITNSLNKYLPIGLTTADVYLNSDVSTVEQTINEQSVKNYNLAVKNVQFKQNNYLVSKTNKVNKKQRSGVVTGKANIYFPNITRPLRWNVQLYPSKVAPKSLPYLQSLPVDTLSGIVNMTGNTLNNVHRMYVTKIDLEGKPVTSNNYPYNIFRTQRLSGNAKITVDTRLDTPELFVRYASSAVQKNTHTPELSFELKGNQNQGYNIKDLQYKGKNGEANIAGLINFKNGLHLNLVSEFKKFKPEALMTTISGMLTGKLDTQVQWNSESKKVAVSNADLQGKLNKRKLVSSGSVLVDFSHMNNSKQENTIVSVEEKLSHLLVDANKFSTQWHDNFINLNGTQKNLDVSFQVNTLSDLVSSIKGTAKGKLKLRNLGEKNKLANIYIVFDKLQTPFISMNSANVQGVLTNSENKQSNLTATIKKLDIPKVKLVDSAQLFIQGTPSRHTIDFKAQQGLFSTDMSLLSNYDALKNTLSTVVNSAKISVKKDSLVLASPFNFVTNFGSDIKVSKHCWRYVSTSIQKEKALCLNESLDFNENTKQVSVAIQELPAKMLVGVMPKKVNILGKLNGQLTYKHERNKPVIDVDASVSSGELVVYTDKKSSEPTRFRFNDINLKAQTIKDILQTRLEFQTPYAGDGSIVFNINSTGETKPITASINVQDLNLHALRPFVESATQLQGKLSTQLTVVGTLDKPKFSGNINLSRGKLALENIPMIYKDIMLTSNIISNKAQVDGSFKSGAGLSNILGVLDFNDGVKGTIKLDGEMLAVDKFPVLTARVNPALELSFDTQMKEVDLTGGVKVIDAVIRPPSTSKMVNENTDVVFTTSQTASNKMHNSNSFSDWNITTDLKLDLQDKVLFKGFGTSIPLKGGLHLIQKRKGLMNSNGRIFINKRVPIQAYGQNLVLTKAELVFTNNLFDPLLRARAQKKIDGYLFGFDINGSLNKPNVNVFNEAGLNEQQATEALITGNISTLADVEDKSEVDIAKDETITNNDNLIADTSSVGNVDNLTNIAAASGLSFGLQRTRAITNEIGRQFGLSGLTLDAYGSQDDTKINVTGYVTPKLSIRYGVSIFTALDEISLRYQLNKRLYIEASSALEQAIDVIYNWKY